MEKDLMERAKALLREHSRDIIHDAETHGGFRDPQQLDDLKDCIMGMKDIAKMEKMEEKTAETRKALV